jgi:hypothetical protein
MLNPVQFFQNHVTFWIWWPRINVGYPVHNYSSYPAKID